MESIEAKILLLFIICPILLGIVSADGGFIPPPYYHKDLYEPVQRAIIFHNSGQEDLILQVKYEGDNISEFVWIVPLPSIPEVNESNVELFNELHSLTQPKIISKAGVSNLFGGAKSMAAEVSREDYLVDLIERKTVGLYDVSVLTAKKAQTLIDWLNTRGYSMKQEALPMIEDYLDKGWYFVAMRIDLDSPDSMLVTKFKEIDERITNLEEAKTYIYEDILQDIADRTAYVDSTASSKIKRGQEPNTYYSELIGSWEYSDWLEKYPSDPENVEQQIANRIDSIIESDLREIRYSLNEGNIQPLKFSFQSEEPVYPLKISSINPGDTEVLLYVFADTKVKPVASSYNLIGACAIGVAESECIPVVNFTLEYANWTEPENLEYYPELTKIIDQKYFLTKIRMKYNSTNPITDDLTLLYYGDNKIFRLTVDENGNPIKNETFFDYLRLAFLELLSKIISRD